MTPEEYQLFVEERTLPARDLAHRVDILVRSAIDLGCGTGCSTKALEEIFHEAKVLGVESDPELLARAIRRFPELPFEKGDWSGLDNHYDLVFSISGLQYVPGHEKVIPFLMDHLNEDGVLAVSIPDTRDEPLFQIASELLKERGLSLGKKDETLSIDQYREILEGCAGDFDLWETTYYHDLPSAEMLVYWLETTRLQEYMALMDEDAQRVYLKELLDRVRDAYPTRPDGSVILKFKRIFFTAVA